MQVEESTAPREAAAAVELSREQLKKKTGTYFNTQRAASRQVTYTEGRLQFEGHDLVPLSENLFFFEVEPQTRVEFVPAEDGTVAKVKTITSSRESSYVRVETMPPTPDELLHCAGRYYCPELDIYWTLVAADDHLVAKRRKYAASQLRPLFRDTFRDDRGPVMGYPATCLIIFERDKQGQIVGLRVSGSRVRHVCFVRQPG